jgi:ABC-2 type transport system permease protein
VLRGVGDAGGTAASDGLHVTSAWPSWLSPIGWAQHVDAFGSNDLTPLLLSLGLAVITAGVAIFMQSRRDVGASVFAGTRGRASASPALGSSFGLAWRLQRSTIIGWAIGGAATGILAGALAPLLRKAADASPAIGNTIESMSNGTTTLDQSFMLVIFSIAGLLASACAVQAVIRLRQEESGGTAELVLASPVSRVRWFVDYLVVGFIAIVAVLGAAYLAAVLGVVSSGGASSLVGDALLAAIAQLPAALVFLGVLALVFTVLPGATAGIGWALIGVLGSVGIFGPLLGAPEAVVRISPFANTPVPFGDNADWSGGFWLLVVAAATLAASTQLMRNRELHTT